MLLSLLPLASLSAALLAGCVEQTHEAQVTEEDIAAAHANVLTTPPTPRYPAQTVLKGPGGGKVTYLGLDIDQASPEVGQSFTLTHYFRVEQPSPEGWKLFVHLDSPDRRGHLTADHVPVGGKYPVARWQTGEIIRDIHKVLVPPTWPADKVQILVGLWKGGSRWSVESGPQDGQNRAIAALLPVRGAAGPPPLKRLLVRKLKPGTALTIDGKLDEPAWKDAATTGSFVNTLDGSPAGQMSMARLLWDDQNLYVAFDFQDSDIWSTFEKHDDKLWTQEAAELFLDADGDGKTYVELQVSPRNVTFDSWLPTYRANDNSWDAPMKTAVQVQGTLNQRGDKDSGWTVEMAIPLTVAKGRLESMRNVPPTVGTQWRANFFRMDQAAGKPQSASGWSPPMRGDFHALDMFGVLQFADELGQVPAPLPPPSPAAVPSGAAVPSPVGTSAPGQLPPVLQRSALANPHGELPPAHPAPAAGSAPTAVQAKPSTAH